MKTKLTSWNLSLIIELLITLIGIGIGIFGICYDSAVVFCIILIVFSVLCATTLLLSQYLCVHFGEAEISVVYLFGTLGATYLEMGDVEVRTLFSARLPFFTYYKLNLTSKTGRRYSFMDGEILYNRKNKYALIAHGARIADPLDKTGNQSATVPTDVRKIEHTMRDTLIKAAHTEGTPIPKFGYEIYGLYLTIRPTGSYRYVKKIGDTVTPLIAVKKCGKNFSTKEL